jgi:hypothetical protein
MHQIDCAKGRITVVVVGKSNPQNKTLGEIYTTTKLRARRKPACLFFSFFRLCLCTLTH